jgi:hypothetical protein
MRRETNWIEVSTLVLGVLGAIGATYKFMSIDAALAQIQYERANEQLLQITGTVAENGNRPSYFLSPNDQHWSHVRRLNLTLQLKNIGDAPLQIGEIDVEVFRKYLRVEEWANILPAPNASLVGRQQGDSTAAPPRVAARLGLVDTADTGDWSQLLKWTYDPRKVTGDIRAGRILRGQSRELPLDFLLDDTGAGPELIKFRITAHPASDDSASWQKQIWTGLYGCGALEGLFGIPLGTHLSAPGAMAPAPGHPPVQAAPAPPPEEPAPKPKA